MKRLSVSLHVFCLMFISQMRGRYQRLSAKDVSGSSEWKICFVIVVKYLNSFSTIASWPIPRAQTWMLSGRLWMVRLRQMFRAKIFVLLLLFVVVNHIGQSSNEPLDDCYGFFLHFQFSWRYQDFWIQDWTWSPCRYVSVSVSKGSIPKLCHLSSKSSEEPPTR